MYAFDVLYMPVPFVPSRAATDPAGRLVDGNVVESDQVQYTYRRKRTTIGQGPDLAIRFWRAKFVCMHKVFWLLRRTSPDDELPPEG